MDQLIPIASKLQDVLGAVGQNTQLDLPQIVVVSIDRQTLRDNKDQTLWDITCLFPRDVLLGLPSSFVDTLLTRYSIPDTINL
jgi:hypothetical protein